MADNKITGADLAIPTHKGDIDQFGLWRNPDIFTSTRSAIAGNDPGYVGA
ncbi:MAG: hypothetical protein R3E79_22570 [Caldilineaceae bacterium]